MKIRFLGTGAADGWPGLFCTCNVCVRSRQVRGKNLRSRSAALIDDTLQFDFSPDALYHAHTHGIDYSQLQFLVYTHGHDDHFAPRELQYLSWMFVETPRTRPLQVVGPPDVCEVVCLMAERCPAPVTASVLTAWKTHRLGDYELTPIVAQHDPARICFNYLLSKGGKTLLYATDTGWYDTPTWDFLRGQRIDGAVIECSKGPVEGGYMAHLSISQVIAMRENLIADGALTSDAPVFTTHHSHLGGLMHEDLEERLAPHGIQPGFDGLEFTL